MDKSHKEDTPNDSVLQKTLQYCICIAGNPISIVKRYTTLVILDLDGDVYFAETTFGAVFPLGVLDLTCLLFTGSENTVAGTVPA